MITLSSELYQALRYAIPYMRKEYMELVSKYAGTPYEQDAVYQQVKQNYEAAKKALERYEEEQT